MSEKLYAWLLYLYPAAFREAHRDDLLQLFRDRLRDETGFLQRARLWSDVALDLIITVPHLHLQPRAVAAGSSGATMFLPLPDEPLRPAAMVSALAVALVAYSFIGLALSRTGSARSSASGAGQSQAAQTDAQRTDSSADASDSASQSDARPAASANQGAYDNKTTSSLERQMAIEAVVANLKQPYSSNVVGQRLANDRILRFRASDLEHQLVLNAVVMNLEQHYYDPVAAQRLAGDLVMRFQRGDDVGATDQEFAAVLSAQLRNASGDASLRVAYNAPAATLPASGSSPGNDCSFSKGRMLPQRVGLLQLERVLAPSDCGPAAASAISSLIHPDALVIDFRDSHDGTSEGFSFISNDFIDRSAPPSDPGSIQSQRARPSVPAAANRSAKIPVYILSSTSTVAALGPFMHDLKMLQHAAAVPPSASGEEDGDVWHRIDDHYAIAVPEGPSMNAQTQRDLEDGVRLRAGIRVPAAEALSTAIGFARARVQAQKKSPPHE